MTYTKVDQGWQVKYESMLELINEDKKDHVSVRLMFSQQLPLQLENTNADISSTLEDPVYISLEFAAGLIQWH